MTHRCIFLSACFLVAIFANAVQASLIGVNDLSVIGSGPGQTEDGFNITRDTVTGLDWLDLTLSLGRRITGFDSVSGEFGPGGDYEGFRFATRAEVETLFLVSAGITGPPIVQTNPPSPEVLALSSLLGRTKNTNFSRSSTGAYDDGTPDDFGLGIVAHRPLPNNATFYNIANDAIATNVGLGQRGSFLVRGGLAPVPEPTSIIVWSLLGLTLSGVFWWRRPSTHGRNC